MLLAATGPGTTPRIQVQVADSRSCASAWSRVSHLCTQSKRDTSCYCSSPRMCSTLISRIMTVHLAKLAESRSSSSKFQYGAANTKQFGRKSSKLSAILINSVLPFLHALYTNAIRRFTNNKYTVCYTSLSFPT